MKRSYPNNALGGDCLHYGCVPSKALITSAKKVYEAQKNADRFGLTISCEADIAKAMERVKMEIAYIQAVDSDERFEKLVVDLYKGIGRFVNEHQIQIENKTVIEGKRIVIATGSRPFILPIDGVKDISYLTNETIFDVKKTPKRLAVIGLELAQLFAWLGSWVTVSEIFLILFGREDADVIPVITKTLEQEITFQLNAMVKKVREENDLKVITYEQDGEEKVIEVDEILIATGRKPNTDAIGLDKIGVNIDGRGNIVVNDYSQTSHSHSYAIGDTNGHFPFTHAAGMEGKLVVRNALFGFKGKVNCLC